MPEILIELGVLDYLSKHEQQFGTDTFIFEEAIANKSRTGYKIKNINESVNALLDVLGIKPAKDTGEILDMHSLKTSFYTLNEEVLSTNMLEALAGNAPSGKGQSAKTYTKLSMKRTKTQFVFSINQIRFPHIEELFGVYACAIAFVLPAKFKNTPDLVCPAKSFAYKSLTVPTALAQQ